VIIHQGFLFTVVCWTIAHPRLVLHVSGRRNTMPSYLLQGWSSYSLLHIVHVDFIMVEVQCQLQELCFAQIVLFLVWEYVDYQSCCTARWLFKSLTVKSFQFNLKFIVFVLLPERSFRKTYVTTSNIYWQPSAIVLCCLHVYILIVEVVRGVKAIFSSMNLLTTCHKCWLHYRVVIARRESQVLRTVGNPDRFFFFFWIIWLRSVGSDLAVIGLVGQGTYKYVYWVLLYRDYWETRSHH